MASSELEAELCFQLAALGLPEPARQFRFNPARRWRADFAWIAQRLIVECDGATYAAGRHNRGAGYAADRERDNWCCEHGWRVLRYTGDQITSGAALAQLERMLGVVPRDPVGTSADGAPG